MTDEELKAEFLTKRGPTQCPSRKAANPRLKLALPKFFIPAAREHDPTADADEISAFNKRRDRRYSQRETNKLNKLAHHQAARADQRGRKRKPNPMIAKLNSIAQAIAAVKQDTKPTIRLVKKEDIVGKN